MANRRRPRPRPRPNSEPLTPASTEIHDVSQSASTSSVTVVSDLPPIPTDETLRECFIQASENARAYMDLRFKHFGTFVVITSLLGAVAFQVDRLSAIRPSLAGIALTLSILFWLLDFRTSQYLADELHRIRVFKELLAVPSTNVPKCTVIFHSSYATSCIFIVVLAMWSIIFLQFLPVI